MYTHTASVPRPPTLREGGHRGVHTHSVSTPSTDSEGGRSQMSEDPEGGTVTAARVSNTH